MKGLESSEYLWALLAELGSFHYWDLSVLQSLSLHHESVVLTRLSKQPHLLLNSPPLVDERT